MSYPLRNPQSIQHWTWLNKSGQTLPSIIKLIFLKNKKVLLQIKKRLLMNKSCLLFLFIKWSLNSAVTRERGSLFHILGSLRKITGIKPPTRTMMNKIFNNIAKMGSIKHKMSGCSKHLGIKTKWKVRLFKTKYNLMSTKK
jgi:hypothetical protein